MKDSKISKMPTLPPPFTPRKVEFVIETREELEELWVRLNVGNATLATIPNATNSSRLGRDIDLPSASNFFGLWSLVDSQL